MQRLLLFLLIASVGLLVFLVNHVLPWMSAGMTILAGLALYTWLMTLAMVHHKRLEMKFPKPVNTQYLPRVSVVVAAHNEESVIRETVLTLSRLNYPDFEILVMDDRSEDDTPKILAALADHLPATLYRYHSRSPQSTPGKSAVLNDALRITNGDVLCVFDADAMVEPDFLQRIVPLLADENVGAVQARKVIINAEENLLTRFQNYEYAGDAHYQCGRESVYGAVELRGNGQLVKRVALDEVGGWNEHTLTDDLDLATRLHLAGWDIRFARKVNVYEEGITTLKPFIRQRLRWSEGMLMRYLEHAGAILTSRKISKRTVWDMLNYVVQFLLPLWIVFDLLSLAFQASSGGDLSRVRMISSLAALPVFVFCGGLVLVVGIKRFTELSLPKAIGWGLLTGIYLSAVWFPITFIMMFKVLFRRNNALTWHRTEHVGRHASHSKGELVAL
ncbi:MAG: glycosyltransferase [Candidatus Melainabacteria bacterium]